jgi:hypothetical protein
MLHRTSIEHPAVTRLLVAHPRELVETLPVPRNGAWEIENGRIHVGGSVQDVLATSMNQAQPGRGGVSSILLVQPTTGVLSIARLFAPGGHYGADEHAHVDEMESGHDLKQFEDGEHADAVRAMRRDVVPMGDATTIEGTLEILSALTWLEDDQELRMDVSSAMGHIREALMTSQHVRNDARIRQSGPDGDPDHLGGDALYAGYRTASMLQSRRRSHGPMMHEGHDEDEHDQANRAMAFIDRAKRCAAVSVDAGTPEPIDDLLKAYGTAGTIYATLTMRDQVVDGRPVFVGDACILQIGEAAVTIRIAD